MEPGTEEQSATRTPSEPGAPPPLPGAAPPVIGPLPSAADAAPPRLPGELTPNVPTGRRLLAILLSLGLGLFLADAVTSLLDNSWILVFKAPLLSIPRAILSLFALVAAFVIYLLMGLTRAVPKRVFLPLSLFTPAAALLMIPAFIYAYGHIQQVSCVLSLCQVVVALAILYRLAGGLRFSWPLVPHQQLGREGFSGRNLFVFLLINVFVLVPMVVAYLGICAALAVGHFSEGFLAVRPAGLTVRVKTYVRADGKRIELVPMAHIGERDFYRKVVQSFPTNSIILMEGVTDDRNLLTNSISYQRMATKLHLTEQQKEFKPTQGKIVSADIDVDQFAKSTIDFLNLVMLIHKKGLNADNLMKVLQYSPPPNFDQQLLDDLLRKRNRRLLQEVQAQLPEADNLVVPWGVAHMPQIAQEIQKAGFRFNELREYHVIRFGPTAGKSKGTE